MGEQDRWFVMSDGLAEAIGWVVVRSAQLDDLLREILDDLIGTHVLLDVLSGATTEWLCNACVKVLNNLDPYFTEMPREVHVSFNRAITDVGKVRQFRNEIVHGTWLPWAVHDEHTLGRPFGGPVDETTLFCMRERRGKESSERAYTVEDVREVARRYDTRMEEIVRAYLAVNQELGLSGRPLPRWMPRVGE